MSTPLVTVSIPTYNRAVLLRATIDSVLAQTFTDFELLICDNSSTDDTVAMVERIGDSRVRVHRHASNIGMQRNWRFALLHPETKYVALVSDDDLFLPHHLENGLKVLEEQAGASFYGCACGTFGENSTVTFRPWWLTDVHQIRCVKPNDRYTAWLRGTAVASCALIIRRRVLDKIECWGGSNWPTSMDWLWWGQLAMMGDFLYDPEIGTQYRWHESNYYKIWRKRPRYAAAEFRWTILTLANLGLRRQVFRPEQLVEEVLTWRAVEASTIVTALARPDADPPLRKAAMEIFHNHPGISLPGASGHTRLAGCIGSWYLRYADQLDRFRAHWPPAEIT